MADIQGLISDPEFTALSPKEQKQLLTDFDPEFGSLSEKEVRQFIKPKESKATGQAGSFLGDYSREAVTALPFYGADTAAEAGYKTGQDVLGKNLAGQTLGTVFGGAMAAGTLFNPLAKGGEYISRIIQSNAERSGEGFSRLFEGGSATGLADKTLLGTQEILPGLKPAATESTIVNFASELLTQARKDPINAALVVEGMRSPQAIQAYKSLPKSTADFAKSTVNTVKSAIEKTVQGTKNLKAAPEDLAAFVTDATKQNQVFQDRLSEGAFEPAIQDIARVKTEKGVAGTEKAVKALNNETFEIVDPLVKATPLESPLFEAESVIARTRDNLSSRISTPAIAERALGPVVRDYLRGLTSDNIIGRYKDISNKLTSFWKSPDQAKFADRIKALEATRETLSENIKTILEEKGVDPQIWSKHGLINEFGDKVVKNYTEELTAFRSKKGEGITGKGGAEASDIMSRIPLVGTGVRALGNLKERFTGGVPELLNKRIDQLLSKTTPSKAPLSVGEKDLLLQGALEQIIKNQDKLKSQRSRQELLEREGATPAELAEGGEAAKTLSQMEKEFQSRLVADPLKEGIQEQFPSAEQTILSQIEAKQLGASPKEIQDYLLQQIRESNTQQAIQEVVPEISSAAREVRKISKSEITSRPTGDLLSDFYYLLNRASDPRTLQRLQNEFQRRLGLKKYVNDRPELRDALGIPEPQPSSNLPRARELELSESIEDLIRSQASP